MHHRSVYVPAYAALDRRLTSKHLHVLVIMAANSIGRGCRMTMAEIGQQMGISRQTVHGYVHKLETCGYIEVQLRGRPNGKRRSSVYTIVYEQKLNGVHRNFGQEKAPVDFSRGAG